MKHILIGFLTVVAGIAITSCEYKEDKLIPNDQVDIISRFDFPEGDAPWDLRLLELSQTFDMLPIYKSFTSADLNRKWTGLSGTVYAFNDINDEMAETYVDFLIDEVFYYYKPEIANKVLPMYFYIIDELRLNEQGEQIVVYNNNGFDYWYLSYYTNQPNFPHDQLYPDGLDYPSDIETLLKWHNGSELNEDEQEVIRACRNAGIYMYLEKSIDRGLIEEPADFKNGIDYSTKLNSSASDPNHFINRGFVHRVEPRTIIRFDLNVIEWHFRTLRNQYSLYTLAKPNFDFKCYVRMAMRFTKEEFELQYPPETYPMVNQRYSMVVNHMRDSYDIDLQKITEGIKD
ncbi:MAG: hypothetical protein ABFS16_16390 [Bacteroidota bacterium]